MIMVTVSMQNAAIPVIGCSSPTSTDVDASGLLACSDDAGLRNFLHILTTLDKKIGKNVPCSMLSGTRFLYL